MRCGPYVTRRTLIALAGVGVFSQVGRAASDHRHRIAFLSGGSKTPNALQAFREAMRGLGYKDDDLVFEVRGAEGHNERLAELARELVQLTPEVIVTGSSAAALAAKEATSTIPIVTAFTADPVGSGLAVSIARPGGNVTGISNIHEDIPAKELEFLKIAAPKTRRVGVISNPGNPSQATELRGAQDGADALGLEIIPIEVHTPSEIDEAFGGAKKQQVDALLVLGDPLFVMERHRIAALASTNRLPAIYGLREHVLAGGLMSYGPDLKESFGRAAIYVDKVLKGAKPADLPFEQPTKFELVVNLTAARALGLAIPDTLLSHADEVIE